MKSIIYTTFLMVPIIGFSQSTASPTNTETTIINQIYNAINSYEPKGSTVPLGQTIINTTKEVTKYIDMNSTFWANMQPNLTTAQNALVKQYKGKSIPMNNKAVGIAFGSLIQGFDTKLAQNYFNPLPKIITFNTNFSNAVNKMYTTITSNPTFGFQNIETDITNFVPIILGTLALKNPQYLSIFSNTTAQKNIEMGVASKFIINPIPGYQINPTSVQTPISN